jgi:hypothetical protein
MLVDFDPETPIDRNGLRMLSGDECMALLASSPMGRVGVVWDVLPVILPVNYVLDGDRILIRTVAGTKLAAALQHTVVAFEVDGYDPFDHSGWSVLVRGPAAELTDPVDLARISHLPLRAWASDEADRTMAIEIALLSGRTVFRGPGADGDGTLWDWHHGNGHRH